MNNELQHYGVIGMKWGRRRTPAQLASSGKQKKAEALKNKNAKAIATKYKQSSVTEKEVKDHKQLYDRFVKSKGKSKEFENWFVDDDDYDADYEETCEHLYYTYKGAEFTYKTQHILKQKLNSIDINNNVHKEVKKLINQKFNEYLNETNEIPFDD